MVGISLALALGRALADEVSILVVESMPLAGSGGDVYQPSFDARSTALGVSSRRVFEAIGIWEQLAPGLCTIDTVHVSTRGRPGSTLLHAHNEGLPALGYVVENQWLGRVLQAQVSSAANVHWCAPAQVEGFAVDADAGRRVTLRQDAQGCLAQGERAVSCELLVIGLLLDQFSHFAD